MTYLASLLQQRLANILELLLGLFSGGTRTVLQWTAPDCLKVLEMLGRPTQ